MGAENNLFNSVSPHIAHHQLLMCKHEALLSPCLWSPMEGDKLPPQPRRCLE